MMFNIVSKRSWFFRISAVLILVSVVMLIAFGLEPGIDFTGGSELTLNFEQDILQEDLEEEMVNLGYTAEVLFSEGNFLVRTVKLTAVEKADLEEALTARFGAVNISRFENINPIIAEETARIAAVAVVVAAIGILIYITWAFHRMPKPFHYGTCTIIALVHDILLVLGIFSVLGAILKWEIDLTFIIGVLAVIGYSVNNTVVVFDRIRENLHRGISANFEVVVNSSLIETLSRSLNTSLTTLVMVLALQLFVGVSIQNFAVVLLIGILAGTYSSLFVAPLLLVAWERGELSRLTRWLPLARR